MKIKYISATFLGILLSCSSGDSVSENTTADENSEIVEGSFSLKGEFVQDAHPTSGMVLINADQTVLSITSFKTDDGPVLELYLSNDLKASKYISLGELKGLEGDFMYDLPSKVNYGTYKYLLVWCVDFSVSFGHAILEKE
jgi:hypothetical protein